MSPPKSYKALYDLPHCRGIALLAAQALASGGGLAAFEGVFRDRGLEFSPLLSDSGAKCQDRRAEYCFEYWKEGGGRGEEEWGAIEGPLPKRLHSAA